MTPPKRSKDRECIFWEKSHKYKLKDRELKSATTFLSKFFSPFDGKAIARRLAKFNRYRGIKGKGVRFYLNEWKEARERGTFIHGELEEVCKGTSPNLTDTKSIPGAAWLNLYKKVNKDVALEPEVLVYNKELGLAGQIDLMATRKTKDGEVVDLVDWKSNKKISTEGYKGAKSKTPIEDLDDCSYTKYMLQLSVYAYMLELEGYTIGELRLVHLLDTKYNVYDIPYRKDVVLKLLEEKENEDSNGD